tara:strand:+ start:189 stop:485 length:297 start_codon:yes stop_codon:yes gene_type:complete
MVKKEKLKTPNWIVEGYDSEEEYEKAKGIKKTNKKEKTFKLRKCPECDSDNVIVVMGLDKSGEWQCNKCKWKGSNIKENILGEEEFMEYLDNKGEAVS